MKPSHLMLLFLVFFTASTLLVMFCSAVPAWSSPMFGGEELEAAPRGMKIELQEDFGEGDDGSYGGYYRQHEDIPSPGVGN